MKITNPKMQTQDGPMTKPSGRTSKSHVLSAREIEAYKKKNKKKKKDS